MTHTAAPAVHDETEAIEILRQLGRTSPSDEEIALAVELLDWGHAAGCANLVAELRRFPEAKVAVEIIEGNGF